MSPGLGRSLRWATGAAAVLVLASCGADEVATTADESQTTAPEEGETPALVCEDPPPAEVAFGSTTDSDLPGEARCFSVQVPEGLSSITFDLTGLTDSLNLFVGYDDIETLQYHIGEFWQSVEDGAADEIVVIENPKSGLYYVKVSPATFRNESPFTLSIGTP